MNFRFHLPQRWPVYLIGALIVLLSLVTLMGERGALHLWRLRGEKNRLDEQNYRWQKENESLRQRVDKIRNDDDYLEKLAREELNMVRPGEIVYRFQNSQRQGNPTKRQLNEGASPPRPEAAQKEPRSGPR
jgi:cell division protein FtsB